MRPLREFPQVQLIDNFFLLLQVIMYVHKLFAALSDAFRCPITSHLNAFQFYAGYHYEPKPTGDYGIIYFAGLTDW